MFTFLAICKILTVTESQKDLNKTFAFTKFLKTELVSNF